jgi:hypothetical protein
MSSESLLVVRLDSSLQRLGVGTNNLANLLAVLEEDECRHGADSELLGNVGNIIDIKLVKAGIGELIGHPSRGRILACVLT